MRSYLGVFQKMVMGLLKMAMVHLMMIKTTLLPSMTILSLLRKIKEIEKEKLMILSRKNLLRKLDLLLKNKMKNLYVSIKFRKVFLNYPFYE